MKAAKGKGAKGKGSVLTKGGLADHLAAAGEVKKVQATKILDALASIAGAELKKSGIFTVPGVVRIKTRTKPATKAGKRVMFGKEVAVKAQPAKTVVKAFAVHALKSSI